MRHARQAGNPGRRVRAELLAGTALLAGLLLAAALPAQAQQSRPWVALWCAPAVYRQAANIAEACGRQVAPDLWTRVRRMTAAYLAAVERLHGPDVARTVQRQFERMTDSSEADRPGFCATQLQGIEQILRNLDSAKGEAEVQQFEAEAAASQDPFTGSCL